MTLDLHEDWFVLSLIALICLGAGTLFGAAVLGGGSSTAQAVLDRYPIELSNVGQHRHDLKDVPADQAPDVEISVEQSRMMPGNVNVRINTTDFRFAPELIGSEHRLGTGHAHVYVDDVLISRSYGPWYHLPRLDPGNHTIKVTLNTNDHQEYAVNGQSIQDTAYIVIDR